MAPAAVNTLGAPTSSPKAEAFPLRGLRGCFPQGAEGGGCRKGAESCSRGAAARAGHLAARLSGPSLWVGCVCLIPVTQRESPALFSRLICRGGGRRLPEPLSPPLAEKSLLFSPAGPNAAGGRSGAAQQLPGVRSSSRPGSPPPGAASLLSQKSLHLQLPENKCPPHGVTHLL